ncbi:hypothetical protein ABK040_009085 [Willaertia magna]
MNIPETSSYSELLNLTAKALQQAFPSYRDFTIGDIVFGIGCVAKEHARQNILQKSLHSPLEDLEEEDEPFLKEEKLFKYHQVLCQRNGTLDDVDSVNKARLLFAKRMLYFANLAYYPVANASEKESVEQLIKEQGSTLNSATLTYLKSLHFEPNLLYYLNNVKSAYQQKFFVKLDEEVQTVVISIRGTYSLSDVFTNLTLHPSKLRVHKLYKKYFDDKEWREKLRKAKTFKLHHYQSTLDNIVEKEDGTIVSEVKKKETNVIDEKKNVTPPTDGVSTIERNKEIKDDGMNDDNNNKEEDITNIFFKRITSQVYGLMEEEEDEEEVNKTVRTSGSEEDLLVEEEGNEENQELEDIIEGFVHAGIIQTAEWVLSNIQDFLLNILFSPKSKYKNYRIVCVGHSLGGGLATLVSILLREIFLERLQRELKEEENNQRKLLSPFPNIEAITFGSCGLFSENLSKWSKSFVSSYVMGADVVPRLSLGQFEQLRIEINNSDWEKSLQSFLDEHNHIASVVWKIDNFLVNWGYSPLLKSCKSLEKLTNSEENSPSAVSIENSSSVTTKTTITSSTVSAVVPASISTSTNNITPIINTTKDDDILNPAAEDTTCNEQQPEEEEIITLFPPGELYLISNENMEEVNNGQKDLSDTILDIINEKIFEVEHSQKQEQVVEEKSSSSSGFFSTLFSTTTSIIKTVATNYLNPEPTKPAYSPDEQDFFNFELFRESIQNNKEDPLTALTSSTIAVSATASTSNSNTTVEAGEYVMKKVDCKHFDRVILSKHMFAHHRLIHFKRSFDWFLKPTSSSTISTQPVGEETIGTKITNSITTTEIDRDLESKKIQTPIP